jgi:hypothetical protein
MALAELDAVALPGQEAGRDELRLGAADHWRAPDSTLYTLGVTRTGSQDLGPVRNLAPVSRQPSQEVSPL